MEGDSIMYKVLIEKSVKRKELVGDFVTTTISIDAVKLFSISEDEWSALKDFVISIRKQKKVA